MVEDRIKQKLRDPILIVKLIKAIGEPVYPNLESLQCLKETNRSTIWRIELFTKNDTIPIVLKIYGGSRKNKVELKIINNEPDNLKEFMPKVYTIMHDNDETWVFMEFIQQISGQIKVTPDVFYQVIPTLAKLHAMTYMKSTQISEREETYIPHYFSTKLVEARVETIAKTADYLQKAMELDHLKEFISPQYDLLMSTLQKGPHFFPELFESGFSIIHGDLHFQNIACNNLELEPWEIKFFDWETSKFAPGWFDLAVLVEILMDFRSDWHRNETEIREKAVQLYADELSKYGITFSTNPLVLYKMAYLQRTLEKGIYTHLKRELQGRPGKLLKRYIEKVTLWGSDLGLFK